MEKKNIYIISVIIAICLIYIYIGIFKTYPIKRAEKNGDFIAGAQIINYDNFEKFTSNINNGLTSSIRITVYSKEGKPIIYDLNYNEGIIYCRTDETKRYFGKFFKDDIEEYTSIFFEEKGFANDYFIANRENNLKKYLFQMPK